MGQIDFKMNNQWNTAIDKLMLWRANNWIKYVTKSTMLTLRIHYDQLLIVSETKVLETINMHSKMKGVYKDDVLILIFSYPENEVRKLKFKIKSNADQCYIKLGVHFPVVSHNSVQSKNHMQTKYRDVNEVMRHALESNESVSTTLPPNYVDFMKLCLLDPTFPHMVRQTQLILQEHDIFKN